MYESVIVEKNQEVNDKSGLKEEIMHVGVKPVLEASTSFSI
jgi:hypothetical protein